MNLFNDKKINIINKDGMVDYYGKIFSKMESDRLYELLLNNINWKNDEAIIYGKHIITKRKIAWYGDSDYSYKYSNISKQALPWTEYLLGLKKKVEQMIESNFNSCLLNLYHNGNEGVTWHSDGEKTLGNTPLIASLSFGAERKFSFKHKQTKQIVSLTLEHGSLLVMKDKTQTNWLHSLPITKKISNLRINLTFRTIFR
ncbi:MAG TPA: alpha-ketoglutarate-dependent dioxygenase AlkB [Candidatus Nitrosocosmicus sp.]